eukprot:CAMPEP_0201569198 /NCGR_PEP_ID=MMETSP0190_2-20130828/10742_1 /ASSEMBLY_ACC=CAM_ASM_000263 /TAXON_ID=37353 /ORGANISM="Rosalina sp." /LENGTH=277 /DNA_ID=CAMNT_0047991251 /DNA_START=1545 /DNA_END=2378 /DNA_ORIENTATION=-
MLGRLLSSAVNDTTKVDVRDRGVFYYKLLKYDAEKAEKIVNCPKISVNSFINQAENDLTDKIFNEFNTLSVIYKKPSELFITEEPLEGATDSEEEDEEDTDDEEKEDVSKDEVDDVSDDNKDEPTDTQQKPPPPQQGGVDDLLGFGGGGGAAPQEPAAPQMKLKVNPTCTSRVFQKHWKAEKEKVEKMSKQLKSEGDASSFEAMANGANFKTMASAPKGRKMKFYFYAQEVDTDAFHFIEVNINLDSLAVSIQIKGQSDLYHDILQFFVYSMNAILT